MRICQTFNSMDLAILVWIVCLTLNTLSHDWRAMDKSPLSRLLFFNLLPVTVYCLARSYKTKIGDLRVITVTLGGFGIYLAFIALAEISELYAVIFPRYIVTAEETEFFGRGRGPFLNPVSNGIFLSVCLCCCWTWWPRINRIGKFGYNISGGFSCSRLFRHTYPKCLAWIHCGCRNLHVVTGIPQAAGDPHPCHNRRCHFCVPFCFKQNLGV